MVVVHDTRHIGAEVQFSFSLATEPREHCTMTARIAICFELSSEALRER